MKRSIFTADHEAFRDSARAFVQRAVEPNAERFIERPHFDRDLWIEAGKQGFPGLVVPAKYGGSEAVTTASTRSRRRSCHAPVWQILHDAGIDPVPRRSTATPPRTPTRRTSADSSAGMVSAPD